MNLQGKALLLVEDEFIIGFDLEDMMAREGAQPVLVSSRQAAIDALGERSFDMAIIDVNLNGETSYPLAEALEDAGCPFVFATGYGDTAHPERFATVPTVSKPYDLAGLKDAMRRADEMQSQG